MGEPKVATTSIPGLYEIDLVLHEDERGWFKENYQRAKARAAGLPELDFVQQNISLNKQAGVLRGVHAEPWDKYVSLASGRAFVAVVELRQGPTFGRVETFELTCSKALLIPEGCGNSYQTLEPNTCYTYSVTGLWSPLVPYVGIDPFDEELAISWPISKSQSILSAKDQQNPSLQALRNTAATR